MSDPQQDAEANASFTIHQSKSALFRVVHADGVWCSVNNFYNFNLTFFNDRHPIPTALHLKYDGVRIAEDMAAREVKEGWFREMEVNVVMSLDAARSMRGTLDYYIGVAEKMLAEQEANRKPE